MKASAQRSARRLLTDHVRLVSKGTMDRPAH